MSERNHSMKLKLVFVMIKGHAGFTHSKLDAGKHINVKIKKVGVASEHS